MECYVTKSKTVFSIKQVGLQSCLLLLKYAALFSLNNVHVMFKGVQAVPWWIPLVPSDTLHCMTSVLLSTYVSVQINTHPTTNTGLFVLVGLFCSALSWFSCVECDLGTQTGSINMLYSGIQVGEKHLWLHIFFVYNIYKNLNKTSP